MKRIYAGRYENGKYGIRRVRGLRYQWQTFLLADESTYDGGWMQSYPSFKKAKLGIAALREVESLKGESK